MRPWAWTLIGVSVSIVVFTGVLAWSTKRVLRAGLPDVSVLKASYPQVIYEGPRKAARVKLLPRRPSGWVPLQGISKEAVGAVVVSEDWAFFEHQGYDPRQIKEVIRESFDAGRFVRGASTITQQVIKNVFLEKDRNVWRKLKELVLAVELEKRLGKRRILEVYLNVAEWGEGIYGIGAAARHYFDKSPEELTAKEGAFLAMLLPNPKKYSVSYRRQELTRYARETVDSILRKMVQARYITEEEREIEQDIPLSFEKVPEIEEQSRLDGRSPIKSNSFI